MAAEDPHSDCAAAITLGVRGLRSEAARFDYDPSQFKLISAENRVADGPRTWWLTFKLERLLPRGLGGQIFMTVHTDRDEATIRGFGE